MQARTIGSIVGAATGIAVGTAATALIGGAINREIDSAHAANQKFHDITGSDVDQVGVISWSPGPISISSGMGGIVHAKSKDELDHLTQLQSTFTNTRAAAHEHANLMIGGISLAAIATMLPAMASDVRLASPSKLGLVTGSLGMMAATGITMLAMGDHRYV